MVKPEFKHFTIANKRTKAQGIYCGRPSPVGNPFEIGKDGSRDDVCDRFGVYLREEYTKNGPITRFMDRLVFMAMHSDAKIVLVCWCDPLRCHTWEIAAFAEELIAKHG